MSSHFVYAPFSLQCALLSSKLLPQTFCLSCIPVQCKGRAKEVLEEQISQGKTDGPASLLDLQGKSTLTRSQHRLPHATFISLSLACFPGLLIIHVLNHTHFNYFLHLCLHVPIAEQSRGEAGSAVAVRLDPRVGASNPSGSALGFPSGLNSAAL